MTNILEVECINVSYGKAAAVRDVSLSLAEGEITCVIGANGAGKSSLLSAIMGMLPAAGIVRFCGTDVSAQPTEERLRAGLSLVTEKRDLFTAMSVIDNLELGAFTRPRTEATATLAEVLSLFPRLDERKHQRAGTLSGGERQMLALGRALMSKPKVLMLDEPSIGLAPLITKEVFRHVSRLREVGIAVLLVEQNARAALAISDRAVVLNLGRVVTAGPARRIAEDGSVVAAYLGAGNGRKEQNAP